MPFKRGKFYYGLLLLGVAGFLWPLRANAASCETESQMTAAQRDALAAAARNLVSKVQSGNVAGLRAETIPAVAEQFGAIAAAANRLKPLVQSATITVNDVYALDASSEPADKPETEFYCGTPVVMLTFSNLPPGKYGLAILQASGVPNPQQISLILSESTGNRWMLAGFLNRPMVEAGHNGIWYWKQARQYAEKDMKWNAWFYYQTAAYLLNPAEFLSSPNLQKLKREMDATRPPSLPGPKPMMLDANGSAFEITAVGTTTEFGGLDLEVNYTPNAAQLVQLRDPVAARKQVVAVMTALAMAYPELRSAFRGIWVRANQGNASVFALDLPMNQIGEGAAGAS
ncbi:MAG: hypothetical protein WAM66_02700 [Acidobacteriaceae bacterium]